MERNRAKLDIVLRGGVVFRLGASELRQQRRHGLRVLVAQVFGVIGCLVFPLFVTPSVPLSRSAELKGSCETPDFAKAVSISQHYALVADGGGGLQVIDISDPANPVICGSVSGVDASDVTILGDSAYIADSVTGLKILDIATPCSPSDTGTFVTPGSARGVCVVDSLAYVADYDNGLVIVNIKNLQLEGHLDVTGLTTRVSVFGQYAYVGRGSGGVWVIDVSDPTNPTQISVLSTPGSSYDVFAGGGLAYVACFSEGLKIYDISNPSAPDSIGAYDTPGNAIGLSVLGDYAYVADDPEGLRVIDVSDPTAPTEVDFLKPGGNAWDVALAHGLVYVADGTSGLMVIDADICDLDHVLHVPSEYPNIQTALDYACVDDTVLVTPGTYSGDGNRDLSFGGRDLVVRSEDGPEATIINCGGTSSDPHVGFVFDNGETSAALLEGFTIRGGFATGGGGAIKCDSSSATIKSCILTQNSADLGGGMGCVNHASPTIIDCRFLANSAQLNGGGITCAYYSSPTLIRCVFSGNSALSGGGGGAHVSYWSSPTFANCTFFENNSFGSGGGVASDSWASPTLESSVVAFSTSGQGVYCGDPGGSATLTCCNVFGNAGGDWVGCIADQEGANGNFSQDPLFCDPGNGDLNLRSCSPCAPGNHPSGNNCGLIGASGVGCYCPWVGITNPPLGNSENGSGAAWGDYDNDGDLDLFVTNWADSNRLFRNDDSAFVDVTCQELPDSAQKSSGVACGDYDNDGWLDLYFANFQGGNKRFRNLGTPWPNFDDTTVGPLGDGGEGKGVAWGDFDNDGCLDLYLVNTGRANKLFWCDGEVDSTGPIADPGRGEGLAWGDYDNDGDLDLYLANLPPDTSRLFSNEGHRTFVNKPDPAINISGCWGGAWGDYNNDGYLDLFVVNDSGTRNLLRNEGPPSWGFEDRTADLPVTDAFADVVWGDFDNDGYLDLYLIKMGPNKLLRNLGPPNFDFEDATSYPLDNGSNGSSASAGDYDGDGELDIYLVNQAGPNVLFRNDSSGSNHWLQVKLAGAGNDSAANVSAIGARVRLVAGGETQIREVSGGSGYLSQNSLPVEFGLGSVTVVDTLEISWPRQCRSKQVLTSLGVDTILTVYETAPPKPVADFYASDTVVCVGDTVLLVDASSGSADSWIWDFGDGTTDTLQNPSHVYSLPDTYTVCLGVSGPCGSDQTCKSEYLEVVASPLASFSCDSTVCVGDTLCFTNRSVGPIDSLLWEFGDGGTSGDMSPCYAYGSVDTYTVCLRVWGGCGSDSICKSVRAIEPPVADFSESGTRVREGMGNSAGGSLVGCLPYEVCFTNQSTGEVDSLLWQFGDGVTDTVPNPCHLYQSSGWYSVVLSVWNGCGGDSLRKTNLIRVLEPPVAAFSTSEALGCDTLGVCFTDQSTGDYLSSWKWLFGDGDSSTVTSPCHYYGSPGLYSVTEVVCTDFCGCDTLVQDSLVWVRELPQARIWMSGEFPDTVAGLAPLGICLADSSSGNYDSTSWSFCGHAFSYASDTCFTFVEPETCSTTLRVWGDCGADTDRVVIAAGAHGYLSFARDTVWVPVLWRDTWIPIYATANIDSISEFRFKVSFSPDSLDFLDSCVTCDLTPSPPWAVSCSDSLVDTVVVWGKMPFGGAPIVPGTTGCIAEVLFKPNGYLLYSYPDTVSTVLRIHAPEFDVANFWCKDAVIKVGFPTPVRESAEIPDRFSLGRPYPNPFNPAATIRYDVPRESRVSLQVFDVSGRLVKTLCDETLVPGRYVVVWDGMNESGRRVASSVYYFRMKAGDFEETRKMVLLK